MATTIGQLADQIYSWLKKCKKNNRLCVSNIATQFKDFATRSVEKALALLEGRGRLIKSSYPRTIKREGNDINEIVILYSVAA